jgi:glycerol-3-phosphate O-acyltransferase
MDSKAPRALARRGMPRRLGPLLTPFARRFLDRIPFPQDDKERIAKLVDEGAVVVWVHRARNPVEHLALARALDREGLPRARFVGGMNVVGLQPFWAFPTWLKGTMGNLADAAKRDEELLDLCVRAGFPAEIFLRRPLTLLTTQSAYRARFIEVLVRAQREQQRKVVLVPVFLAMRQQPGHFEPTPLDAVFGTVEEPGLLRALGRVVGAGDQARFEISDPIDLEAFVKEHGALEDAVIAKKVRWVLLHHLARVERLCHGPPLKSAARMRDDLKKDPQLLAYVGQLAKENGMPKVALERRIEKLHDEIAAQPDIDVARVLSRLLDVIWKRIYEGIDVDEEGVRRLREAGKRGPLVIVPSHRSHVDYLVMSQVMLKRGLQPPLVAAGENLNFFPIGGLFRRGGAFFLRRSMKGDPFYVAVFKAYVRRVFAEGFSLEFFIEGGRSRTGKTLPPKLGLLGMIVEAFLESREKDAMFVPCHIAYERVVEAGTYAGELGGKAKQKESAKELLGAASVLTRRYGRVYVTFDEPISLAAHLASRGATREILDEDGRRAAIQTLGHRIVYGINRSGVVTAISLVCASLLGFRAKAVDEEALVRGAVLLCAHLQKKPPGTVRAQPGLLEDVEGSVRAALAGLIADGAVIRTAVSERAYVAAVESAALEIDAHKNQLLHHVVPECIVAVATSMAGVKPGVAVERGEVKDAALELSRVLKLEVIFRYGASFDELFDAAVEESASRGLLVLEDGSAGGPARIALPTTEEARVARRFARNLLIGFLETYHAVAVTAAQRLDPGRGDRLDDKALIQRALTDVQGQVLTGAITAAEAASKVTIENAVQLLKERRALVSENGVLAIGDARELQRLTDLLRRARPRAR